MYFGARRTWDGGHASAGVTAPATEWFLAEGATGPYFDTYVLVGNPNADAVDVTFTFLLPDGRTVSASRSVPGRGRLTLPVEQVDPALASTGFSTRVTATRPVIAERAMYWPEDASTWAEAHNSFGVTEAATRWGLAEGRVGGDQGFETYILLANPTAQAAEVRVTFLHDDRGPEERTYSVPPTSRFNILLDARTAPPDVGPRFGAIVESSNGVPIVVERAIYWNAGTQAWAGGTCAVAVRLPE
jgi:hypothetical protein